MLITLAKGDPTIWMPEQASTYAHEVDALFYFIYWVSLFFFVLIGGLMFYFAWKYRRRDPNDNPRGSHHNNTLEVTWTVIPTIIMLIIFVWGFRSFRNMSVAPAGSIDVMVEAWQWNWLFTYPNGAVSDELWVPVDRPVRLIMTSNDVIHSFFVPQFRTKQDIVPGRYNYAWFEADTIGEYKLYCAEYCGTLHSQMVAKVKVTSYEEFIAEIDELVDFINHMAPADAGETVVGRCASCHTTDGATSIGPTFLDLYGKMSTLRDGSQVLVDEEYIRRSIRDPSAQIVAGFQDQMVPPPVKDEEIDVVIAYLKYISKNYTGDKALLKKKPEPAEGGEEGEAPAAAPAETGATESKIQE